ncbi:PadR family transcriptional regulator [Bacillus pumilus]|uniref:PadR family transcriptional regulator n=1 Tax=Bacillus pumilus TaxID=1408 RepID=UPI000D0462C4|nr:PadR family transcriptional regulator [Bacillus pumilus]MCW4682963.1 PadR family transcriptional regulator [Bacillus pumilus]MCY7540523.1 PadR family transcriptional regulator [Bacillus pumilus]MEC3593560.1 PadR family transcriptional regulator [Bacillus pumilus]PRS09132.1 PadR family transcriptional regulator [Bacillus pumilus]PRS26554.1 PadR family transcriptional regulator [Bacillus pumilus]
MRVLKYAILGLLDQCELTGYDITKHFKDSLGQFWSAKHSQIYPELKRLTEEGFIEFDVRIQGKKLEKKVYQITEAGQAALHQWLRTKDPIPETTKDEFMLKTFFISSMDKKEAADLFTHQLLERTKKVDMLKQKLHALIEEDRGAESLYSAQFGHYLVLTRAIEREKGYVRWLEQTLKRIDSSSL